MLPGLMSPWWGRSGSGSVEATFVSPRIAPGDPQQKLTSWSFELTQPSVEPH